MVQIPQPSDGPKHRKRTGIGTYFRHDGPYGGIRRRPLQKALHGLLPVGGTRSMVQNDRQLLGSPGQCRDLQQSVVVGIEENRLGAFRDVDTNLLSGLVEMHLLPIDVIST